MSDSSTTNLDKSLQKIDYIFRWTGMNLESARKTAAENKKYKFLFLFTFLWVNSDVAGAISWFINGTRQGESLTSLTYVAPCITLTFLSDLKSLFFLIYEQKVNDLIAILRNLEIKQNQRPKKEDGKAAIIKKETEFLHLILKMLNFFNWGLIVSFPVMTLIPIVLGYIKTRKLVLLLPLLIEYPFDAFNPKIWPFVFARQVYSTIIVVLQICGADYFFYICSIYIHIQFRLLQHDLERLIPNRDLSLGVVEDSPEFKRKFAELIDWHQQLIRSVELLEVIYSKSTLFNFVSSSALICLTGFNVTTIDDLAFVVSFLSFLFMSLLQIFFLCFFGDTLLTSSVEVSEGVYNSKWYLADVKISKKMLYAQVRVEVSEGVYNSKWYLADVKISKKMLYAQVRSQKPCKLTAFGFAEVNLRAFTKILSTAWSYFALLKTVYSTKEN